MTSQVVHPATSVSARRDRRPVPRRRRGHHTGTGLKTDEQSTDPQHVFAHHRHLEAQSGHGWGIQERMIDVHPQPERARGTEQGCCSSDACAKARR